MRKYGGGRDQSRLALGTPMQHVACIWALKPTQYTTWQQLFHNSNTGTLTLI